MDEDTLNETSRDHKYIDVMLTSNIQRPVLAFHSLSTVRYIFAEVVCILQNNGDILRL